MQSGVANLENNLAVSQKFKHSYYMTQQFHPTPPKRNENILTQKHKTQIFTVVLFIIAKMWKNPKCLSTDVRLNKMWYIIQWNIFHP